MSQLLQHAVAQPCSTVSHLAAAPARSQWPAVCEAPVAAALALAVSLPALWVSALRRALCCGPNPPACRVLWRAPWCRRLAAELAMAIPPPCAWGANLHPDADACIHPAAFRVQGAAKKAGARAPRLHESWTPPQLHARPRSSPQYNPSGAQQEWREAGPGGAWGWAAATWPRLAAFPRCQPIRVHDLQWRMRAIGCLDQFLCCRVLCCQFHGHEAKSPNNLQFTLTERHKAECSVWPSFGDTLRLPYPRVACLACYKSG